MRFATLSIAILLVLGAGSALAQSRTVSTANMPKPGVSYISGPGAPERRETVSTGTLPTPARLYVGGQVVTGSYSSSQSGGSYGDGGYADNSYYGGGYYTGGYPGGGRPGNGHDHGHNGGHDGDHDHGRPDRPNPGNTVTVGGSSNNTNRDNTRFGVAPVKTNDGRHDHGGYGNGYGNGYGPRPSINEPPPRPYLPAPGQNNSSNGRSVGSGPGPIIAPGASTPTRGRGL
ncbi:hypothetical protein FIV34_03030 [Luteibacter pinisoli]|uniref:Translation initiation factor IF-2 n=1 Tax=Luteibacter pinisoli TaxID=2589080 RepID=A0A4Y5Z164_9GAMM|nr:hypothetical protein [Luteibacter pinisoli]QDE38248.1 hypothetical protein FIV34_03030 [Luteibacter pinisoli]